MVLGGEGYALIIKEAYIYSIFTNYISFLAIKGNFMDIRYNPPPPPLTGWFSISGTICCTWLTPGVN